jgi:DNA gyrase/topoisomerase IV subunit A
MKPKPMSQQESLILKELQQTKSEIHARELLYWTSCDERRQLRLYIHNLRERGYRIASNNKGYVFCKSLKEFKEKDTRTKFALSILSNVKRMESRAADKENPMLRRVK